MRSCEISHTTHHTTHHTPHTRVIITTHTHTHTHLHTCLHRTHSIWTVKIKDTTAPRQIWTSRCQLTTTEIVPHRLEAITGQSSPRFQRMSDRVAEFNETNHINNGNYYLYIDQLANVSDTRIVGRDGFKPCRVFTRCGFCLSYEQMPDRMLQFHRFK